MNYVMKRPVDQKDIKAAIKEAAKRNLPDIAVWLLKFEESSNLELSFYQGLLAKAVKDRHVLLVDYLIDKKLAEEVNLLDINKKTRGILTPKNDNGNVELEKAKNKKEAKKDSDANEKENFADSDNKSTKKNRGVCSNSSCNVQSVHRCSRCRKVAYCSTQCQEEHWPAHQENCKPQTRRKKTVMEEVD